MSFSVWHDDVLVNRSHARSRPNVLKTLAVWRLGDFSDRHGDSRLRIGGLRGPGRHCELERIGCAGQNGCRTHIASDGIRPIAFIAPFPARCGGAKCLSRPRNHTIKSSCNVPKYRDDPKPKKKKHPIANKSCWVSASAVRTRVQGGGPRR